MQKLIDDFIEKVKERKKNTDFIFLIGGEKNDQVNNNQSKWSLFSRRMYKELNPHQLMFIRTYLQEFLKQLQEECLEAILKSEQKLNNK